MWFWLHASLSVAALIGGILGVIFGSKLPADKFEGVSIYDVHKASCCNRRKHSDEDTANTRPPERCQGRQNLAYPGSVQLFGLRSLHVLKALAHLGTSTRIVCTANPMKQPCMRMCCFRAQRCAC